MDYNICRQCRYFHQSEDVFFNKDVLTCSCNLEKDGCASWDGFSKIITMAPKLDGIGGWTRKIIFDTIEMPDKSCEYYVEHMMYDCNLNWFRKKRSDFIRKFVIGNKKLTLKERIVKAVFVTFIGAYIILYVTKLFYDIMKMSGK